MKLDSVLFFGNLAKGQNNALPPKRANPIEDSSPETSWFKHLVDAVCQEVVKRIGPQTLASGRRLLTVSQAAEYLGRTPNAVYLMIRSGKIPSTRTDGRVMIDVRQLERLIEQNTHD